MRSQSAPVGTPQQRQIYEQLKYLAAVDWWGPASVLKHMPGLTRDRWFESPFAPAASQTELRAAKRAGRWAFALFTPARLRPPQDARYLRLVQPDQLASVRQAGVGRRGVGEDSSVAMIAGSYLGRSRVHHSVAVIAWYGHRVSLTGLHC